MNTHVPAPPSGGGLLAHLSRSLRRGSAKWTAVSGWTDRDGLALPPTLFVIHCDTALERWWKEGDRNLVEHKTEHPLPDLEVLNAAIPRAEWKLGLNGQPEKPWKLIYIVVMIDTAGGAIYTYKNSTYGALLMYEQLTERIAVMQMLRGERVMPIVRLEKRTWQSTTYGPQPRPHLEPIEWRKFGGDESPAPQLAAPAPTPIPAPAAATANVYAPIATPPIVASTGAPAAPPAAVATTAPAATPTSPSPSPSPSPSTVLDHTQPVKPITVGELIDDKLPPWA
jgi:hypothetical protein